MNDGPVLLSVEDVGQGGGLLAVPVEEPLLVDVGDHAVVTVESITSEITRVSMEFDHASRFRPNHLGSPHGSPTASQKSLSGVVEWSR